MCRWIKSGVAWVCDGIEWNAGGYAVVANQRRYTYSAWKIDNPKMYAEFNTLEEAQHWCEVMYAVGA